jgi:hypothetical protein
MVHSSTIGISSSSDPVEIPNDFKVTSSGNPDSTLDIVGNVSDLAELVGVGPGVLGRGRRGACEWVELEGVRASFEVDAIAEVEAELELELGGPHRSRSAVLIAA